MPNNEKLEPPTVDRTHGNRLLRETSPYLQQHAHNPVDWYPWGDEALAAARREDKPILLSIGYAACHWCHVMAHESFENAETARLINDAFVAIKVDREERPDIDALYMDAVVALTGSGGWPMTVFLTPDGAPFYGGTYFPPVDRHGLPSFSRLLHSLAALWVSRRDEVEQQAEAFRSFYRDRSAVRLAQLDVPEGDSQKLRLEVLATASETLVAEADSVNGGFGGAPKFPHAMALEFLLRMALRNRQSEAGLTSEPLRVALLSLDRMANGGIYDHVGGGFHRYATDARWLVPHFEKMLYDNALLARVYLHAWQLTGEARYRTVCEETLEYVLREMRDPRGGFYSSQDADSGGEEGRFYTWTLGELQEALGADVARLAQRAWGVTLAGNFEGRNILHAATSVHALSESNGLSEDEVVSRLAAARERLYDARSRRAWPARDEKVLAGWNGLVQRTLAEAGHALDRQDFRDAAVANADFLLSALMPHGRLLRSWRDGAANITGFLEDYGSVVNALLTTYGVSGERRFFTAAQDLAAEMLRRFWDEGQGSFFDTALDGEQLIGRPRELTDNATPSGTNLALEALLRLGALTGEARWRSIAIRMVEALSSLAIRQPTAFGHLLGVLDDLIGPFAEIAIVGPPQERGRLGLERVVAGRYLPRAVLAMGSEADAKSPSSPLLAERGMLGGRAAAYVCQGFVCRQPVATAEELATLLDALG